MVKERKNHCFEPLSFGVVYSIAEDNHYMDQVGMDAKAQPVKTASQFWFLHLWLLVKIFLCKECFYSIFLSFIVINSSNMRVLRPPQKLRNCILSSEAGKGAGWMVSVFFKSEISCLQEMTELGWGKELEFRDLPALSPPTPTLMGAILILFVYICIYFDNTFLSTRCVPVKYFLEILLARPLTGEPVCSLTERFVCYKTSLKSTAVYSIFSESFSEGGSIFQER